MQSHYMKCTETHTYETDVMLGCAMPKTEPIGSEGSVRGHWEEMSADCWGWHS